MSRPRIKGRIAYPALIPYPIFSFVGTALKFFLILACAASVPFSLYRCYLAFEHVAHNSKPTSTVTFRRQQQDPIPKGHRP